MTTKRTVITKTYDGVITRQELLDLLKSRHPNISDDATFYVRVPGGGDWSNTNLEIGDDTSLHFQWVEQTHEETDV